MICLIDTRSRLSIATLVFYTCIWFPIKQMKQTVLDIVSSIISVFDPPIKGNDGLINESIDSLMVHLPAANFNENIMLRAENGGERDCSAADASCSICLVGYESEDMVVRLPRCGHVFHRDCINKWLDRNQFTCPLCRDLLLHVNPLPCNGKRRDFH